MEILLLIFFVLNIADYFLDIIGRILENTVKIIRILKEQKKKPVPQKRKRTKR